MQNETKKKEHETKTRGQTLKVMKHNYLLELLLFFDLPLSVLVCLVRVEGAHNILGGGCDGCRVMVMMAMMGCR